MMCIEPINLMRLRGQEDDYRRSFTDAYPWPHIIIDDFLALDFAIAAGLKFPPITGARKHLGRLLGARSYRGLPDDVDSSLKAIDRAVLSPEFSRFVEKVTGIDLLEPDRERIGAGIHQGVRGSHLRIHADHNTHPKHAGLYRRVNVLVYFNHEWHDEWGGNLELWDRNATSCQKRIAPLFNRCVILGVDDTAFHGYAPLRTPTGLTRNALAAYFYSDQPAAGQESLPHRTRLPVLPNETYLSRFGYRIRGAVEARVKRLLGLPH